MARILIIDDSETVIRAVRALLAADGHVVDQLDFFVDLASTLRKRPPDLIVLDIDMPGFSGARLGSFVRDQCRSTVPIVIYSSRSPRELDELANRLGRALSVPKDAPMTVLRAAVSSALETTRMTA